MGDRLLAVDIHGIPAPQGSKTALGGGRMRESSTAVGPWREAVRAETQAVLRCAPWRPARRAEPVQVTAFFYLKRPASHYRANGEVKESAPLFPVTRPDGDKLERAVFDGLKAGGALHDDAQIVVQLARKFYADGRPPGAMIWLESLEAPDVHP